jgi:hypothetical protein
MRSTDSLKASIDMNHTLTDPLIALGKLNCQGSGGELYSVLRTSAGST